MNLLSFLNKKLWCSNLLLLSFECTAFWASGTTLQVGSGRLRECSVDRAGYLQLPSVPAVATLVIDIFLPEFLLSLLLEL